MQLTSIDRLLAVYGQALSEPYRQRLTISPPAALLSDGSRQSGREYSIPATVYQEPVMIKEIISQIADNLQTSDLRVAASLWSLWYSGVILLPVISLLSLSSVGLDASLERSYCLVREDGRPLRVFFQEPVFTVAFSAHSRSTLGDHAIDQPVQTINDLYAFVIHSAFAQNLVPVWQTLRKITRISPKVLWGNTAEMLATYFARMLQCSGFQSVHQSILHDYHLFLHAPTLPILGKNPLSDTLSYHKSDACSASFWQRRTCCLYYRSPGKERCSNCPLRY